MFFQIIVLKKNLFFDYRNCALLNVKCHTPQYISDPQMDCRSLLIKNLDTNPCLIFITEYFCNSKCLASCQTSQCINSLRIKCETNENDTEHTIRYSNTVFDSSFTSLISNHYFCYTPCLKKKQAKLFLL